MGREFWQKRLKDNLDAQDQTWQLIHKELIAARRIEYENFLGKLFEERRIIEEKLAIY